MVYIRNTNQQENQKQGSDRPCDVQSILERIAILYLLQTLVSPFRNVGK